MSKMASPHSVIQLPIRTALHQALHRLLRWTPRIAARWNRLRVIVRWGRLAADNYIDILARCSDVDRVQLGRGIRLDAACELLIKESIQSSGVLGTIIISDCSHISSGSTLWSYGSTISIGKRTLIGAKCHIGAYGAGIYVGNNVLVSPLCSMVDTQHIFIDHKIPIYTQGITSKGIMIQDDVWLGTGVVVMDGVHIGQGAIIGAGAIVTHDIPPYAIAIGIPARVVKWRKVSGQPVERK